MLRSVAANQNLPARYLEHLLRMLKHAGLVRVARGSKGGFALARPPEEIKLREIVEALEGDLSVVECVSSPGDCEYAAVCVTRDVWSGMSRVVRDYLDSMTLADLAKRAEGQATRCPPPEEEPSDETPSSGSAASEISNR